MYRALLQTDVLLAHTEGKGQKVMSCVWPFFCLFQPLTTRETGIHVIASPRANGRAEGQVNTHGDTIAPIAVNTSNAESTDSTYTRDKTHIVRRFATFSTLTDVTVTPARESLAGR